MIEVATRKASDLGLPKGRPGRRALELTFTAPMSLSVLWESADLTTRTQIAGLLSKARESVIAVLFAQDGVLPTDGMLTIRRERSPEDGGLQDIVILPAADLPSAAELPLLADLVEGLFEEAVEEGMEAIGLVPTKPQPPVAPVVWASNAEGYFDPIHGNHDGAGRRM